MTTPGGELTGRSLHPGHARGRLLRLDEPLSFWGGVSADGVVIDRRHPQRDTSITGRVVAMESGRGSSSATAVLAELVRSGHGPAAILLAECDTILVIGALVAAEMYGTELPLVQLEPTMLASLAGLPDGAMLEITAGAAPRPATVRMEA